MDSFLFEGQQRTARQLAKEYPAYSPGRWQTVLERGCQTLAAAMNESARLDNARDHSRVLGGRKAARNSASRVTVMPRAQEWMP